MKITLKLKDKQFRLNYLKNETNFKLLKAISNNQFLPFKLRLKSTYKINKIFINSSKSKFVNRCLITNRGRAVYRPFSLTRHQLKKLSSETVLNGIKKSIR